MPELTLDILRTEASVFSRAFSARPIPDLYGITDGKAVGTFGEHAFRDYLAHRYSHERGNSASGIDFPALGADLKVTSIR